MLIFTSSHAENRTIFQHSKKTMYVCSYPFFSAKLENSFLRISKRNSTSTKHTQHCISCQMLVQFWKTLFHLVLSCNFQHSTDAILICWTTKHHSYILNVGNRLFHFSHFHPFLMNFFSFCVFIAFVGVAVKIYNFSFALVLLHS